MTETYAKLTEPFAQRNIDPRGNPYIKGEQAIERLNEVFGVEGWSFTIIRSEHNEAADEVWVQGDLATLSGIAGDGRKQWTHVQQFGSAKLKRYSQGANKGNPLDYGNDLQGAATDCLKKCAKMRGIGLHLAQAAPAQRRTQNQPQAFQPTRERDVNDAPRQLRCAECNDDIKGVRFQNGSQWTAQQLADQGAARFREQLCRTHFFARSQPQQRAS